MSANPLIALQTRTPDVGAAFSNALLNLGRINQLQRSREEQPLRSRILEAQAQTREAAVPTATEQRLKSVVNAAVQLNTMPQDDRLAFAKNRRADLISDAQTRGVSANTEDTDLFISKMESGDFTGAQSLIDNSIQAGQQLGIIKLPSATMGLASAKTEILESGSVIQALPDGTVQVRNPSGEVVEGQDRLDVLSQSRQQAITTLQAESDIKAEQAGKAEKLKLKAQLKLKPQLEEAVIEARASATEKGEVFTDLSRMNAALPGLKDTVNTLRELAPIATSTFGGRLFNAAVKESGFGTTKGATARAKFTAIVNNQVLPLLKPTFGAAFTVQEGETLKATLGDPNASPQEKMAQLDAFITQKIRDIETKEAQLGQTPSAGNDLTAEEQAELNALEAELGNP